MMGLHGCVEEGVWDGEVGRLLELLWNNSGNEREVDMIQFLSELSMPAGVSERIQRKEISNDGVEY